jgi:hypothetical protein
MILAGVEGGSLVQRASQGVPPENDRLDEVAEQLPGTLIVVEVVDGSSVVALAPPVTRQCMNDFAVWLKHINADTCTTAHPWWRITARTKEGR